MSIGGVMRLHVSRRVGFVAAVGITSLVASMALGASRTVSAAPNVTVPPIPVVVQNTLTQPVPVKADPIPYGIYNQWVPGQASSAGVLEMAIKVESSVRVEVQVRVSMPVGSNPSVFLKWPDSGGVSSGGMFISVMKDGQTFSDGKTTYEYYLGHTDFPIYLPATTLNVSVQSGGVVGQLTASFEINGIKLG
jgi:hypothetical protein